MWYIIKLNLRLVLEVGIGVGVEVVLDFSASTQTTWNAGVEIQAETEPSNPVAGMYDHSTHVTQKWQG